MIDECSQISTRKPQAVFKVIRGDEGKRYGEASFKAEEKIEKGDRGCHIFCRNEHFSGRAASSTTITLRSSRT